MHFWKHLSLTVEKNSWAYAVASSCCTWLTSGFPPPCHSNTHSHACTSRQTFGPSVGCGDPCQPPRLGVFGFRFQLDVFFRPFFFFFRRCNFASHSSFRNPIHAPSPPDPKLLLPSNESLVPSPSSLLYFPMAPFSVFGPFPPPNQPMLDPRTSFLRVLDRRSSTFHPRVLFLGW